MMNEMSDIGTINES